MTLIDCSQIVSNGWSGWALSGISLPSGLISFGIANRAELAAAELRSRGVSEENIKDFVASVGKPNGEDPALKLRDCATRHSEISLNLLDFMEKQWAIGTMTHPREWL